MNQGETVSDYVCRVLNEDYPYNSTDKCIPEFCPVNMQDLNSKIQTCPETFYFSYTSGEQKTFKKKLNEQMRQPSQTSNLAFGFDVEIK